MTERRGRLMEILLSLLCMRRGGKPFESSLSPTLTPGRGGAGSARHVDRAVVGAGCPLASVTPVFQPACQSPWRHVDWIVGVTAGAGPCGREAGASKTKLTPSPSP